MVMTAHLQMIAQSPVRLLKHAKTILLARMMMTVQADVMWSKNAKTVHPAQWTAIVKPLARLLERATMTRQHPVLLIRIVPKIMTTVSYQVTLALPTRRAKQSVTNAQPIKPVKHLVILAQMTRRA